MSEKNARLMIIISGGLFLLLDQILKWAAQNLWTQNYPVSSFLGWYPYHNSGIAFGLPVANSYTIAISAILIIGMLALTLLAWKKNNILPLLGWIYLTGGAISNLADRIACGYVIDYLFILTGYINIGDVMIVSGLLVLLGANKK
jgi:lipoprotein signal peptidase